MSLPFRTSKAGQSRINTGSGSEINGSPSSNGGLLGESGRDRMRGRTAACSHKLTSPNLVTWPLSGCKGLGSNCSLENFRAEAYFLYFEAFRLGPVQQESKVAFVVFR